MPKAEQLSEGKGHAKNARRCSPVLDATLREVKTPEPVRDLASKGQNQFVIYASFRETLVPTPNPTKAQQDTEKRRSFPDETHVRLKGRCVCDARFTPGREARKNGPRPKDTAGVRSLQSAPKSEAFRARKSRRSSEVCARGSCLNRRTMCRKPNNYQKAKDTQKRKAMFSSFRRYFSGS